MRVPFNNNSLSLFVKEKIKLNCCNFASFYHNIIFRLLGKCWHCGRYGHNTTGHLILIWRIKSIGKTSHGTFGILLEYCYPAHNNNSMSYYLSGQQEFCQDTFQQPNLANRCAKTNNWLADLGYCTRHCQRLCPHKALPADSSHKHPSILPVPP